jgi:hypothetical protein
MIDREEAVSDIAPRLVRFSDTVASFLGLPPLTLDQATVVARNAHSMAVLLGRSNWVDVWDLSIGNEPGVYSVAAERETDDLGIPF